VIGPFSRRPYGAHRRRTACILASLCVGTLVLTSCDTPGKPVPSRSPQTATRSAPTASHDGDSCPTSQAEVRSATGKPVRPPQGDVTEAGGCVFRYTDDSGGVDITVESERTPQAARDYIESSYRSADLCCTRRRTPGLGQQAVVISGPRTGTSVLVRLGRKVLVVNVDLPSISPQAAINLAALCAPRV
jgi:hypothetical protein